MAVFEGRSIFGVLVRNFFPRGGLQGSFVPVYRKVLRPPSDFALVLSLYANATGVALLRIAKVNRSSCNRFPVHGLSIILMRCRSLLIQLPQRFSPPRSLPLLLLLPPHDPPRLFLGPPIPRT